MVFNSLVCLIILRYNYKLFYEMTNYRQLKLRIGNDILFIILFIYRFMGYQNFFNNLVKPKFSLNMFPVFTFFVFFNYIEIYL